VNEKEFLTTNYTNQHELLVSKSEKPSVFVQKINNLAASSEVCCFPWVVAVGISYSLFRTKVRGMKPSARIKNEGQIEISYNEFVPYVPFVVNSSS
jgi:hypothetical protein